MAQFIDIVFNKGGIRLLVTGLQNTLIIAVFAVVIGLILGTIIAAIKVMPSSRAAVRLAKRACDVYIAVVRGTPVLVQLLIVAFAIFPKLNMPLVLAIGVFGLNSAAYLAESIRGGINAVDKGQSEAGRSLGLGYWFIMLRIVLPQAIKNILPSIGNEFIALIKETSVAGLISVIELTKATQLIVGKTYSAFVPYITLAVIYFILVIVFTQVILRVERRLSASERN